MTSAKSSNTNVRRYHRNYDRSTQERRNREQGWRTLQAYRPDPEAHDRADGRRPPIGRARWPHDRSGSRRAGNPAGQDRNRLHRERTGYADEVTRSHRRGAEDAEKKRAFVFSASSAP